jgi:molybdopterin converting factor small subunit
MATIKLVGFGRILEKQLEEGKTLGEILGDIAEDLNIEITRNGVDVRVNGKPGLEDTVLEDGDVVTAIPQVKGGM